MQLDTLRTRQTSYYAKSMNATRPKGQPETEGATEDWQTVSVRMSPGLMRAINLYMVSHGMRDRSELIREAVSEFIKYAPTPEEVEAELRRIVTVGRKKH